MSVVEKFHLALLNLQDWDAFLMKESRLPGPRSNLELLCACSDLASRERIVRWLDLSAQQAPENTPLCFLACCGVMGLGRLLAEGDRATLALLRDFASDPRWRVREAVCMALQRFGKTDMPALLDEMTIWATATPYVQRAAMAALCEPALLIDERYAACVLNLLDSVTRSLISIPDRKQDDFRVLRKGLAYCWSVAVVASPERGKLLMENWIKHPDKDICWVMKQNLQKNRLLKLDPEWTGKYSKQMESKR